MPEYEVTVCRTTESITRISISATSEEEAEAKAKTLINQPGWALNVEWELEDETDEILEIGEE